jgi:transposase
MVGSGRRLGGDPFAWLKDILERLPTQPIDRRAELLPGMWFAAHPRARRKAAS